MEHSIPSPRSAEAPQGAEGFLERMRALTETNGSSLYDLYNKEGDSAVFQDALDTLVFDVAFEDEEYAANAAKLQSGRLKEHEAQEIAARQREKAIAIRRIVLSEARIPTEAMRDDIEKGQAIVVDKLKDIDLEHTDSDEVLHKLGVLSEDNDGKIVFTFPRDLFPESVVEKWDTYMISVKNHVKMGHNVEGGLASKGELENADMTRKYAHDSVTSDVHKILGLDKLSDEEWDLAKTRNLIAKMRDAKFGDNTSESIVTSKAFSRGLGSLSLNAVAKLAARKN